MTKTNDGPPFPINMMYATPAEERDLLFASLDTGTLLFALNMLWIGYAREAVSFDTALALVIPIQRELAARIPQPAVGSARLPRLPDVPAEYKARYDAEREEPAYTTDAVTAQRFANTAAASREASGPDPDVTVISLEDLLDKVLRRSSSSGYVPPRTSTPSRNGLRQPATRNRGRS
jgi:hypothetical protein